MAKKGFVQEVKELEDTFPFDDDLNVTLPIIADVNLTEHTSIPMYGSITVQESIALGRLGEGDMDENRVIDTVLLFLKSRSHPLWTRERVLKLGSGKILKAFNAFSAEMVRTNKDGGFEDEPEKKEPTGQPSTGDSVVDIPAIADLTPTDLENAQSPSSEEP
jgi:hypothetical protein